MQKVLLLLTSTLLLAACSPEKMFELVAKSDVEQAASEAVNQSTDIINSVDNIIKQNSSNYDSNTKLESVTADGSYGYAFKNTFDQNNGFSHEVVAVLPPLDQENAFYEGWLVNPTTNKFISTGPLSFDEVNNTRSLIFKDNTDYSSYSKIIITAEYDTDPKPGKHILEGEF